MARDCDFKPGCSDIVCRYECDRFIDLLKRAVFAESVCGTCDGSGLVLRSNRHGARRVPCGRCYGTGISPASAEAASAMQELATRQWGICSHCGKAEEGWAGGRCPNCGEPKATANQ